MALTNTALANQAFMLIGASPITDINSTSVDRAIQAKTLLEMTRTELLRGHPWNFATIHERIFAYTVENATLTLGALAGTEIVVEADAEIWGAVDVGRRIRPLTGGGEALIIEVIDENTVVVNITRPFSSLELEEGEWRLYHIKPAHTYEFAIPFTVLTGTYLRAHEKETRDERAFRVVGRYFHTNEEILDLEYVADVVNPTVWPPDFESALVHLLAARLAFPITGRGDLAKGLFELYAERLADAKVNDAQEGTPEEPGTNVLGFVRGSGVRVMSRAQNRFGF
jgi:hypothetical protein